MKAQTAATILRATRSRLEDNGWLQLGRQEIIALLFAYEQSQDEHLMNIVTMHTASALQQFKVGKPVIMGWKTPEEVNVVYETFRAAYKTLDKVDVSYEFKAEEFLKAQAEKTAPAPTSDWLTQALGSAASDEIKKFLDNKPKDPQDMN